MIVMDNKAIPTTRKEAIMRGIKYYFTGRPCIRGHVVKRSIADTNCPVCRVERRTLWQQSPKGREYQYEYRKTLKWKEIQRKSVYGLEHGQFEKILNKQSGRCAICHKDTPGISGRNWHIDHCHKTGKIRGLLCHSCNVALGHFRDDPMLLRLAAEYLDGNKITISVSLNEKDLIGPEEDGDNP